jgi:hypothetical protein
MYFKQLLLGLMLVNITAFFVTPVRADNPYDAKARSLESEADRLIDASKSTCDLLSVKARNSGDAYRARAKVFGEYDKVALQHLKNGIYYARFAKLKGCSWAKDFKY